MRHTQRFFALLGAGIAMVVLVALSGVRPAFADPSIVIQSELGYVNIRSGPHSASGWVGTVPSGSTPTYQCYTRGEFVLGTNIWFRVSWNGLTGYYSSRYDNVPLSKQSDINTHYGIPQCLDDAVINQTPAGDITVNPAPINYNGQWAANWALVHARDEQPLHYPGCTRFVSLALWYGGMHQTEQWNGFGEHGRIRKVPGTVTSTSAHDLYRFLVDQELAEEVNLYADRFNKNAVPEARVGDVIAYDWSYEPDSDASGVEFKADHLTIVAAIAPGEYPEVSEWGTNEWPDSTIDYQKRGWTWSEKHGKWLQADNPHVRAKLLRIMP